MWPLAFRLLDETEAAGVLHEQDEDSRNALTWSAYTQPSQEADDIGCKILQQTQGEDLDQLDKVSYLSFILSSSLRPHLVILVCG